MKTRIFSIITTLLCAAILSFGQKSYIVLSFTAIDSATYVQLDSIRIINRTQGGDTVLYWPDTMLILDTVGIPESYETGGFSLFQNYPNPIQDHTTITLYIPEKGKVELSVSDVLGKRMINYKQKLSRGYHTFRFTPGAGELYFFTVTWNGHRQGIKMIHSGLGSDRACTLAYTGYEGIEMNLKSKWGSGGFGFSSGDELLYIGYADTLASGMLDMPESNEDYKFQYATNIPCPGTPTVTYEGQVYNTIQVFSQCWLKENLNVGVMINSSQNQTDNGIIEKYCLGDMQSYCVTYGGLYFWNEMMQYINQPGSQGICPDGWHVPTDEEWKVLEGAIDSQYGIGSPEWDEWDWRGYDAGGNLKETGTTHWWDPNTGATDAFGFTALPGGYFIQNAFWGVGYRGIFRTSENQHVFVRVLDAPEKEVERKSGGSGAFSLRCLKD